MSQQLPLFAPVDRTGPWSVRVSARARRLSVRVYPGGKVEVVVPPRVGGATVQRFIRQHRGWIEDKVRQWQMEASPVPVRPERLELPALGRSLVVRYRPASGKTVAREVIGDPGVIEVSGAVESLRSVAASLECWLRRQVADAVTAQLSTLAAAGGFRFGRVSVRRQRTRWGSCSSRGTLSLNVCLAFLPPDVVRYLLIHELCHTEHMNHSRRFWALVERHEPDFRRLNRELSRGWRQVPGWILL